MLDAGSSPLDPGPTSGLGVEGGALARSRLELPGASGYHASVGKRVTRAAATDMDDLFNDIWRLPRSIGSRGGFRPAVDLYRRKDPPALVAVVELPGVDPSDVEIAVADGRLLIAGHRRRNAAGERVVQLEIEHGAFHAQVELPEDVDAAAAAAHFDRGLLTIALPVAQRAVLRRSVTITMTRST